MITLSIKIAQKSLKTVSPLRVCKGKVKDKGFIRVWAVKTPGEDSNGRWTGPRLLQPRGYQLKNMVIYLPPKPLSSACQVCGRNVCLYL